jgi:hypothetical protein
VAEPDTTQLTLSFEPPERWRDVVGFEGFYLVSDLGRVRSLPRRVSSGAILGARSGGRDILSYRPSPGGYPRVRLSRHGTSKCYLVHHLVTNAFLGPLPPGLCRRHKNGIKMDCRLANLEFGTPSENVQDSLRLGLINWAKGEDHCCAVLTEAKVREMRQRRATGGISYHALATEYGVSYSAVYGAVTRRTWKHVA